MLFLYGEIGFRLIRRGKVFSVHGSGVISGVFTAPLKKQVFYFPALAHGSVRENKNLLWYALCRVLTP